MIHLQNKISVFILFICFFISSANQVNAFNFDVSFAQSELIELKYQKNKLSYGYFKLHENSYYYIILPNKSVSFFNKSGQKQIQNDFQYRMTEVSEEEKDNFLAEEEYDSFFKLDNEVVRKEFFRAEPVGGFKQFYLDFMRRFNLPKEITANYKADFIVKISIDSEGNLSNFLILNSSNFYSENLKKEILRVFKTLPKFNPALLEGKAVSSEYLLPLKISVSIK